MKPDVSVCIPAYRQPEVLLRTIESVLIQKNCVFELIVTDDSDDDSVEIVLQNFKFDKRIRYFRNLKRFGAVGNWNACIEKARAGIIKIMHHDDWFNDDCALSRSIEPILNGKTLIVFSACRAMSVSGDELFTHCAKPEQLMSLETHPESLAFANFIGPPSVVTFSRDVFLEFNLRYTWLADIDFYIRLIKKAKGKFIYLIEPLINVTADSPRQLSRECEEKKLRSVMENIYLFSGIDRILLPTKNVHEHFVSLAKGLSVVESSKAAYLSCRLGRMDIAWALIQGLLLSKVRYKR